MSSNNLKTSWLIWSIPASFFSLVFVIRILPSFVMQSMVTFYDINYAQFSLLPAFYYAGYSLMQIPTGVLLTKFKNSTIIPALMLIVCFGAFLLSVSSIFALSCIAAFIIGTGSTIGVLGSSSIIKSRFDEQSYAFILGLTLAFGLVAASYAGNIINTGLQFFNWQQLYKVASIIVFIYAIMAFIVIKKGRKPSAVPDVSSESTISLLKQALKTKNIIFIAIFSGLMTTPMQGFADVWGISFLSTKFNLSNTEAIFCNSLIFLGMGLGSPIIGMIAQKYGKMFFSIILCGTIMFSGFVLMLLPIHMNKLSLSLILLCIGIGSSFPTLTFTLIVEDVDHKISKIAMSLTNMALMLSGSIFHPLIGGTYDIAIRMTDKLTAYSIAIGVIPLGLFIGIIGLLYCVQFRNKGRFLG